MHEASNFKPLTYICWRGFLTIGTDAKYPLKPVTAVFVHIRALHVYTSLTSYSTVHQAVNSTSYDITFLQLFHPSPNTEVWSASDSGTRNTMSFLLQHFQPWNAQSESYESTPKMLVALQSWLNKCLHSRASYTVLRPPGGTEERVHYFILITGNVNTASSGTKVPHSWKKQSQTADKGLFSCSRVP